LPFSGFWSSFLEFPWEGVARGTDIFSLEETWDSMKLVITTILLLAGICAMSAMGQESSDYWAAQGQQHSTEGRFQEAADSYDRAIELDSSNATLFINKGLALANLGQFERAVDSWDRALKIDTSNSDVWYFRGLALSTGLGQNEEAVASFEQVLNIDPTNSNAWVNKGMAQANLGLLDDAVASFDEALKIDPQDPVAWNNKGVVLRQMGRYPSALTCFEEALKIDPDYEVAKGNLESTVQEARSASQNDFYELDDILYQNKVREGSLMN
jgi:tetratricopeptide (TPR) repeat protein